MSIKPYFLEKTNSFKINHLLFYLWKLDPMTVLVVWLIHQSNTVLLLHFGVKRRIKESLESLSSDLPRPFMNCNHPTKRLRPTSFHTGWHKIAEAEMEYGCIDIYTIHIYAALYRIFVECKYSHYYQLLLPVLPVVKILIRCDSWFTVKNEAHNIVRVSNLSHCCCHCYSRLAKQKKSIRL